MKGMEKINYYFENYNVWLKKNYYYIGNNNQFFSKTSFSIWLQLQMSIYLLSNRNEII